MTIKRHAGLTFSDNKTTLAIPYRLKQGSSPPGDSHQVFLHIPKCGGTTLHFIIACCANFSRRSYTRYVIRHINPPVFIRDGWTGAWDEVMGASIDDNSGPACFSGHFPYGVHEHIGADCRYVTLVRDPAAREVSSFNHHYQKGFLDGDASMLMKLVDQRAVLDNPQVRMLAGVEYMSGPCSEETYRRALDNMASHFSLVGTVERSTEFTRALLAISGWPAVAYVRTQVSAVKAIPGVDDALRKLLHEYHAYDARLHTQVTQDWETWKNTNIDGERELDPAEPVIYLPPDIHTSRQPRLLRAEQIQAALRGMPT